MQVHYYEDGNVQLVSSKDVKETVKTSVSDLSKTWFINMCVHLGTEPYLTSVQRSFVSLSVRAITSYMKTLHKQNYTKAKHCTKDSLCIIYSKVNLSE